MSLPEIRWDEMTDGCAIVRELRRYFQANNKSGIATCLAQLKNNPKRCREFTRQTSSLDILVQLLRCRNHAIVNMSLSILADACMTTDVREKVKYSKIGFYVVLIIKDLKLSARLHCRACRLISNLTECSWHAKELCNDGVVEALKTLIMSNTDMETYCMAVRAIRNIWNFYVHVRGKIMEAEIIKLVTQLFVMAEMQSVVKTKYIELVNMCLKAMCAFLNTLDLRCGKQMQVDKYMQGYKCLMRCCSVGNNKMAVKCLYTLCQIPECRLELGISGSIEQLISLISMANNSSKCLYEEILISLCLFCRESVNRERIKNGAGLQLIVTLLNKSEYERYHSELLQALSQFIYDEIALDILAEHGILEVLVAKLTDVVSMESENNTSRKRLYNHSFEEPCTLKYMRLYGGRFSMDFYRDDWSPKSATSASSSSSPPSTPPLTLYSTKIDETEDNIYSPICSDTDCGNNDEEEEAASLKSCKSLTTVKADHSDFPSDSEMPRKTNLCEFYTLLLLDRLSLSLKPIYKLADSTTIKSLMTYLKYTKTQTVHYNVTFAFKILIRIIGNVAYFMPLLKQGLVFELQTLQSSSEREECMSHLGRVSETGSAVGQLAHILLRGKEEYKLLTAVSIPFLIKTQLNLKLLLNKCGGLQLIFRLMMESSHELHERAIWSICQLAKRLQIDPIDRSNTVERDYTRVPLEEKRQRKPMAPSKVLFKLDDGTTIATYRRKLCEFSDVFSAMLEGHFNESGRKRVRLRNTSRGGMEALILAMNRITLENCSIESVLDAVLLADKFLMPESLVDALTECSMAKLNTSNDFCRVWRWARSYSCHELRSYCVKSFLTATMTLSETTRKFRDFYATDAFDEFMREVKGIIEGALCQC